LRGANKQFVHTTKQFTWQQVELSALKRTSGKFGKCGDRVFRQNERHKREAFRFSEKNY
jgi:uncharacterized protein YehS (DUF1456 family)